MQAEFKAVKSDCSVFLRCEPTGCFAFKCGPGTEYLPATQTCVHILMGRKDCKQDPKTLENISPF